MSQLLIFYILIQSYKTFFKFQADKGQRTVESPEWMARVEDSKCTHNLRHWDFVRIHLSSTMGTMGPIVLHRISQLNRVSLAQKRNHTRVALHLSNYSIIIMKIFFCILFDIKSLVVHIIFDCQNSQSFAVAWYSR